MSRRTSNQAQRPGQQVQQGQTVRGYLASVAAAIGCCSSGIGGIGYDAVNEYESSWLAGRLNAPNSVYFRYFFKYLFQDLVSLFDFSGLPDEWSEEYFIFNLLCRGWISFVKAAPYGWIPQACTWGGTRNVFGFPLTVLVANGWFNPTDSRLEYTLDKDAYFLHTSPGFTPLADIPAFYADKLSCLFSTFDNSAILSRNGYILASDSKAMSMTIEQALVGVLNSEFLVSLNYKSQAGEGPLKEHVEILESDVKKHYICTEVLLDAENLIDQYHGDLGFPVVNRSKKERVQAAEQYSLNESVTGKSENWFDLLQKDLDRFNAASGLSIRVRRRAQKGGGDNGTLSENTAEQSAAI